MYVELFTSKVILLIGCTLTFFCIHYHLYEPCNDHRQSLFKVQTLKEKFTKNKCIDQSYDSIASLVHCLSKYYWPENSIHTINEYLSKSDLTLSNFNAFKELCMHIWKTGDCDGGTQVPPELAEWIALKEIVRQQTKFCVIFEKNINSRGMFEKGIGILVISNRNATVAEFDNKFDSVHGILSKTNMTGWTSHDYKPSPSTSSSKYLHLHLQAPHPIFDKGTDLQAAFLFDEIPFKSLLISTRHRSAFHYPSPCIMASKHTGSDTSNFLYDITDPTHSDTEPFHQLSLLINEFDRIGKNVFIQLHAKSKSSCPHDDIFLSAGIGAEVLDFRSDFQKGVHLDMSDRNSDNNIYTKNPHWIINRLYHSLQQSNKKYHDQDENQLQTKLTISLPTNSSCFLIAKRNVFGRILNGVHENKSCTENARPSQVDGKFIHIEQSRLAIDQSSLIIWIEAFRNLFSNH